MDNKLVCVCVCALLTWKVSHERFLTDCSQWLTSSKVSWLLAATAQDLTSHNEQWTQAGRRAAWWRKALHNRNIQQHFTVFLLSSITSNSHLLGCWLCNSGLAFTMLLSTSSSIRGTSIWRLYKYRVFTYKLLSLLWSPYVIGQTIIFLPCYFYLLLFFPRLISAAVGWMSTIRWHMVWP